MRHLAVLQRSHILLIFRRLSESESFLNDHSNQANYRQSGYELWYDYEQVDGSQDRDGQGAGEARRRTRVVSARLPKGREDVDPTAHHPGPAHRQRHRALPGDGSGRGAGGSLRALEDCEGGRGSPQGGEPARRADVRRGGRGRHRHPRAELAEPQIGPQWRASLQTYAYPSLGALPVSEIPPGHVMAVLEPIWNEKRETARRVKQRISAICRWAVAQGHRTDDPAGVAIDAALPRNGVKRRHRPALPTRRWPSVSRRCA